MLVTWALALSLLLVVSVQQRVPAEYLVLDAASVPGGRWYYGAVTSLGIMAWTVAAGACAVTGYAAGLAGRRSARVVFGRAAVVVVVLLLDDLFLVHGWLSSLLSLPAGTIPVMQVGTIVAFVVTGWRELRRTRWELLVAAGGALTISTLVDLLDRPLYDGMWTVAEEGAKFLGILALAVWAMHTAAQVIASMLGPAETVSSAQEPAGSTDPR